MDMGVGGVWEGLAQSPTIYNLTLPLLAVPQKPLYLLSFQPS